jgi:hypothetical protein
MTPKKLTLYRSRCTGPTPQGQVCQRCESGFFSYRPQWYCERRVLNVEMWIRVPPVLATRRSRCARNSLVPAVRYSYHSCLPYRTRRLARISRLRARAFHPWHECTGLSSPFSVISLLMRSNSHITCVNKRASRLPICFARLL